MRSTRLRRWQKWTIGGLAALVVVAVGGPLVYKLFNKADPKAEEDFTELAEEAGANADPVTLDTLAGGWVTITPTTEETIDTFYVGYRVNEVLAGQKVTANGRTSDVAGTLTFDGATLTSADFTAQLAGVTSGRSSRDGQFRGRIMAVSQFPTATFVLTEPITLEAVPAEADVVTVSATGNLTARGTTKEVTFEIKAFHSAGRITVTGEIPVVFEEWGIPNPSSGPATTEDHGSMEFLLTFERAG